jgi:hypothetical protein
MKPCAKNKKSIAWLALDALGLREATALRDHLAQCEGCRRYWQEVLNVTEGLAAGMPDSDIEASESFHRGVADKLRGTDPASAVERVTAWLRGSVLAWRVALPGAAAMLIIFLAIVASLRSPSVFPTLAQSKPASGHEDDVPPTIGNYRTVANQSLEKLSEVLTRQGNKPLPPSRTYTALSLELVSAAD